MRRPGHPSKRLGLRLVPHLDGGNTKLAKQAHQSLSVALAGDSDMVIAFGRRCVKVVTDIEYLRPPQPSLGLHLAQLRDRFNRVAEVLDRGNSVGHEKLALPLAIMNVHVD